MRSIYELKHYISYKHRYNKHLNSVANKNQHIKFAIYGWFVPATKNFYNTMKRFHSATFKNSSKSLHIKTTLLQQRKY